MILCGTLIYGVVDHGMLILEFMETFPTFYNLTFYFGYIL